MSANQKRMARFFVALNVILAALVGLTDFHNDVSRVVNAAGLWGHIALACLLAAGAIALFDVLVNDVLPKRFVYKFALEYRHTIYMLITLGCLSMVFVLVRGASSGLALAHYGSVAYLAMTIAVLDTRDRVLGIPR